MNKQDQELWEQALLNGERTNSVESYFADLIRADEREACAELCEKQDAFNPLNYPEICAKAIRARGNK
jgi:hypothetical protein